MDDGKHMEDAFWQKKPLHGRQTTSAGVLSAYGKDTTSIRSGFFLQKLCLQNILHNNRKVLEAFNEVPGDHSSRQAWYLIQRLKQPRHYDETNYEGKSEKPDCRPNLLQEEYQRLRTLTANLQTKLNSHSYRVDFELRVNGWLSTTQPVSDFEIKRKDFIKALLAMMHPE